MRFDKEQNTSEYKNTPVKFEREILSSPFYETTRDGNRFQTVILALTLSRLIIRKSEDYPFDRVNNTSRRTEHYLKSTHLVVFKKTRRQTIKIQFNKYQLRYFELVDTGPHKAAWPVWCRSIIKIYHNGQLNEELDPLYFDWRIVFSKSEPQKVIWRDKYLYMGSKRELEDSSRPTPVPGLGLTKDFQLFYLKPQYFGCWDQSEHWVQCDSS